MKGQKSKKQYPGLRITVHGNIEEITQNSFQPTSGDTDFGFGIVSV